ncbi:hypothetical protein Daus18300_000169 [Diaporthe australafricana]|uniref:Uncharacterized protein n=1 Tax=Diaporthe australafricana TaxID=127596 RepID=A0ABR3Y825_9PEZI
MRAQIVAPIHLLQRRDSPLGGWRGGPTWGMINATSYTPLESLLLFTWIRKTGAEAFEAAAFPKLSRDLINNVSIKEDPTYDASRLNPDSLQELFLQLLQDELKNEATLHQQQDATAADPSLSPNSKKRKRPGSAPQLTNLHEARQHAHRLPDAEAKLWAKYKQRTAQNLWEEQEELARLEAEIQQIQLQQQKQQAVEADNLRKSASATSSAPLDAAGPPNRPRSVAPAGDAHKAGRQPNGTTGPPTQPPTPVPGTAPNHAGHPPPPRQVSPARAAGAPTPSQPFVQSPVASQPAQVAKAAGPPQVSPRPPSAPPRHPPHHPRRMFCRGQTILRNPDIRLSHHPPRYPFPDRSNGSPLISHIPSLNTRDRQRTLDSSLHSQASNAHSNGVHNPPCHIIPSHHYSQPNKATGSSMDRSMDRSIYRSKVRQGHDKFLSRRNQLVMRLLRCNRRL